MHRIGDIPLDHTIPLEYLVSDTICIESFIGQGYGMTGINIGVIQVGCVPVGWALCYVIAE